MCFCVCVCACNILTIYDCLPTAHDEENAAVTACMYACMIYVYIYVYIYLHAHDNEEDAAINVEQVGSLADGARAADHRGDEGEDSDHDQSNRWCLYFW